MYKVKGKSMPTYINITQHEGVAHLTQHKGVVSPSVGNTDCLGDLCPSCVGSLLQSERYMD